MNQVNHEWIDHVIAGQGLSPGIQAFTTTRGHGYSAAPYDAFNLGDHVADNPAHVRQNRQLLSGALPQAPCWLNQVHGVTVFDADAPLTHPYEVPTADAAVTTRSDRVLAILTADCLPVVISADQHTVLGVAHAGWRGLADGVLLTTLAAMRAKVPEPLTLRAWIGPSIGPQAFQVGDEVRARFLSMSADLEVYFQADPAVADKWLADLAGIAGWQLQQNGVVTVRNSGLCTVLDKQKRFFSYRRDGQTGRMATVAWISEKAALLDQK